MCCRYYLGSSPELNPIYEAAERSLLTERFTAHLNRPLVTEGEVRPTNFVPAIAPSKTGERSVFPMVWGFRLPRSRAPLGSHNVKGECDIFCNVLLFPNFSHFSKHLKLLIIGSIIPPSQSCGGGQYVPTDLEC